MIKKIATFLALILVFGLSHALPVHAASTNATVFSDPANSNFSISPDAGITGSGTFVENAHVTATAATTVALKVAWGTSNNDLSNLTEVYQKNSQVVLGNYALTASGPDSVVDVSFNLSNLPTNAVYYYAYVNPTSPDKRYTNILSFTLGTPVTGPLNPNDPTVLSQHGLVIIDNGGAIAPSATTDSSLTFSLTVQSDKSGTLPLKLRYDKTSSASVSTLSKVSSQVFNQHVDANKVYNIDYTLSGLQPSTTYYFAVVDGGDTSHAYSNIYSATTSAIGTTSAGGTVVQSSVSGFYIIPNMGGERGATTFKGYGEIYSVKPVTVNLQVIWGETADTMNKTVDLYLEDSTITLGSYVLDGSGDHVPVMFTLTGLQAPQSGKTYFYAYVKNGFPQVRYTDPIPVKVFGTTTSGATPPPTPTTPTTPVGTGGGLLNISGIFNGGLVPCDGSTVKCTFSSIFKLINTVIKFLIILTFPIAAVVVAYVGVLFLTSGGSEEARGKAKHAFMNVVIGLVFVLGAWVIVATILTALGVGSAYKFF